MSMANFMWRAQSVLHGKNNPIVPMGLLSAAFSLIVINHVQRDPGRAHEPDPLRTFLAMVMAQMLPLVFLELKLISCADPVGLFCKFAVPVTLTHVIFLAMRFLIYQHYESCYVLCSALGLVAALYTMLEGFLWSPNTIFKHKSVHGLATLSVLGGVFTVWSTAHLSDVEGTANPIKWLLQHEYLGDVLTEILELSISYLEIMAFVPAVWMVFREDKGADRVQIEELDSKRTSTAFFLFLVTFYLSEDLLNAMLAWPHSALAGTAHIVHFCLLLDFACYVLAHIYNPEKLLGELRKWLPIDLSYEV